MTRRDHVEDVAAFALAIVLLAIGFATSWPWLVAGLIIAALVIRDLVRKLRASDSTRTAGAQPSRVSAVRGGEGPRLADPPGQRVGVPGPR